MCNDARWWHSKEVPIFFRSSRNQSSTEWQEQQQSTLKRAFTGNHLQLNQGFWSYRDPSFYGIQERSFYIPKWKGFIISQIYMGKPFENGQNLISCNFSCCFASLAGKSSTISFSSTLCVHFWVPFADAAILTPPGKLPPPPTAAKKRKIFDLLAN